MKISKAQQQILDESKRRIDTARKYNTYDEYFINEEASRCNSNYNTPEKYKSRNIEDWNKNIEYWERHRNGIVLTRCNTKSLLNLESLGLIEIIYNSNNEVCGIDRIRILNY
jgi:hypothetical protein